MCFNKPYDLKKIDQIIFNSGSPFNAQFKKFADTIEQSKNLETFYYTVDGNILCLKGKEIAENQSYPEVISGRNDRYAEEIGNHTEYGEGIHGSL